MGVGLCQREIWIIREQAVHITQCGHYNWSCTPRIFLNSAMLAKRKAGKHYRSMYSGRAIAGAFLHIPSKAEGTILRVRL